MHDDLIEIAVTPVLTVHALYASGDYVGTSGAAMVFSKAARVTGESGTILAAEIIDNVLASVAIELWLFKAAPTPPADSAAWSISDADAANLIGVIPFSTYYASALNSIANGVIPNGQLPFVAPSGDLYGCLVTRGAPAYTANDLTVKLLIDRD